MEPKKENSELSKLILEAEAGLLSGLRTIDHEIYHDPKCPGLSRSAILKILESPLHYKNWLANPTEPTAKMEFGIDCHAAVLEPKAFEKRYTHYPKAPEFEGRSKAAIEARESFSKQNAGKKILDAEDFEKIGKIIQSIYQSKEAVELLDGAKEMTQFFVDPQTKLLCKVRPDVLHKNQIIDLKFTSNGSRSGFVKSASQLNYHIQAAFYLDAFGMETFKFLCIEDHEPFEISVFELDAESLDLGRKQYQKALQTYREATQTQIWKGYSKTTQLVRLQQWKFFEGGEDL